ncbi:MAG TPA: HD domain-containing protein [Acholeplasmataceae bacterium]|nr:HD domain-containing protein [Acholeplasmataceae bacterium]
MISKRLLQQMDFISEIEKLKVIYRQNGVIGGKRQENSAEHSWHISIMAFILLEYCNQKIDVLKVIKMLLIHDVIEIVTGDTFLYDDEKRKEVKLPEKEAANQIFGLLPQDQKNDFLQCWNEFELKETPESKYANVLDNLQPIINHFYTNNQNIKGKCLTKEQIIKKKEFIKEYSEEIWEFALSIIDKSVQIGLYKEKEN